MARSYLNEIRVTRNSQARHRSLAGGLVVGDYVEQSSGERVLTIKMIPVGGGKAKKSKPKQDTTAAIQAAESKGAVRGA